MSATAATIFLEDADPAMILARAAELAENAVKDKTYRLTPIGRIGGEFLDEQAFNNQSAKTVDGREQTVAWLALFYAHLDPSDLTTDHLKRFLHHFWRDAAPNTRAKHVSGVRVFSEWAHDHGYFATDIGRKLKVPKATDTKRIAHTQSVIRRLVVGQDQRRDRVALLLLYWCALRRNELRLVQWRHIDLARRILVVFGKGGKVLEQAIPEPVALELERYVQDEAPHADEFLLYPQKVGRRGRYPLYAVDVVWEDRGRPMTESAIDKWWQRCVSRSGLDHFPMHEIRHSAGTHFHEAGRDLVATQHFMRHASAATTERTYLHLDRVKHVAEVQRAMVDPLKDVDR